MNNDSARLQNFKLAITASVNESLNVLTVFLENMNSHDAYNNLLNPQNGQVQSSGDQPGVPNQTVMQNGSLQQNQVFGQQHINLQANIHHQNSAQHQLNYHQNSNFNAVNSQRHRVVSPRGFPNNQISPSREHACLNQSHPPLHGSQQNTHAHQLNFLSNPVTQPVFQSQVRNTVRNHVLNQIPNTNNCSTPSQPTIGIEQLSDTNSNFSSDDEIPPMPPLIYEGKMIITPETDSHFKQMFECTNPDFWCEPRATISKFYQERNETLENNKKQYRERANRNKENRKRRRDQSDDDSCDSDDGVRQQLLDELKKNQIKFDEIPQYDTEDLKKDRLVDLKIPEGLITSNGTLAENFMDEYREARENSLFLSEVFILDND